ncbi:MAG: ParB/RepB/Spo0J family partition protein [Bacilli bacterium]|nr:ParB/RepB/Spo0J family partition protein [Bacilli bacterium]
METNNKRKALGKGLEQLFSNSVIDFEKFENQIVNDAKTTGDVVEINLDEVRPNPYQPRKVFNEESLNELAKSISEYGVIQPIIVKKSIKGYEIVAGERRTRAAKMAGLKTIPAIIKEFDDNEMMEIALIENIQRENLNPIEEALSYENIIRLRNFTQEEVAEKFGKSRSYITNILGLLRLPKYTTELVSKGELSMGHARVLSKLDDDELIDSLAAKIVKEGISVRETENLVKEKDYAKKVKIVRNNPPMFNIFENAMREKIGTKVKIKSNKIEIPFDSEKDLERILEIINISIDGD